MTKNIEIKLINPDTNKVEVHTREAELTVEDKLNFAELQDTFAKEAQAGKMSNVRAIKIRTAFLASLFDLSESTIIKGIKSYEFDDVCKNIFSKISPEDFEDEGDENEEMGK